MIHFYFAQKSVTFVRNLNKFTHNEIHKVFHNYDVVWASSVECSAN